eukprot:Skav217187  [mRNA]  locus=scaffold557:37670:43281:+ [translate_table: standard]
MIPPSNARIRNLYQVDGEASDASTATAALWTVPALKPFLIFELEVPDMPRTQSESPQVDAALAEMKRQQAPSSPGAVSELGSRPWPSVASCVSVRPCERGKVSECFSTEKGSVICELPVLKFLKSSMGF